MPDPTPAAPAGKRSAPYPSLAALRADHSRLVREYKREAALSPGDRDDLLDRAVEFVRWGRATGTVLGASEDRFAAQGLLTYWSNVLYRAGRPAGETDLVDFNPQEAPRLDNVENPFRDVGRPAGGPSPGWDRLIDEAVRAADEVRLVAVLGVSGSGRQALIRDGLIPALRAGRLPGSDQWDYLPTIIPGAEPFAALAGALAPNNPATWATLLAADPAGTAAQLAAARPRPTVVVVRRVGDVFSATDPARARAFADALAALTDPAHGHRVVLTVNPSRLGPVDALGPFGRRFRQGQVLVAFSAAELRQMVTRPAQGVGLRFDDGVVDRLLMDVQGDPAALALLRFTLGLLWGAREGNRITHEAYDRLGGGRLAVGRRAEEVYGRLDPAGREAARALLLRLIRPATGAGVSCHRVPHEQLLRGLPAAAPAALGTLEAEGLVVAVPRDDGVGPPDVAPVHEALATAWPRFLRWLEEDREREQWRARLLAAAEQWRGQGRKSGALWSGAVLTVALEEAVRARAEHPLGDLEEEFLRRSEQRAGLVWWVGRGGFAAAVLALAAAAVAYDRYEQRAQAQLAEANGKVLAAKEKAATELAQLKTEQNAAALRENAAWQLFAAGGDQRMEELAGAYLRYALSWKDEVDAQADRPPTGERAFDHLLRLGTTRRQLPTLRGLAYQADGQSPTAAAQAADGRVALTAGVVTTPAGFDLVVRTWRPGPGGLLQPREDRRPHAGRDGARTPTQIGVYVSPDGRAAAAVLSWDVRGVVYPLRLPDEGNPRWETPVPYDGVLTDAKMSPDGKYFAAATYRVMDRTAEKLPPSAKSRVLVWGVADWSPARSPGATEYDGKLGGLAFAPPGDAPMLAAVVGADSPDPATVCLEWQLDRDGATRKYKAEAAKADEEVLVAAYSPAAYQALFVSRGHGEGGAGKNSTAWLFDTKSAKGSRADTPAGQVTTAAVFSPQGDRLATGTKAGGVFHWRLERQEAKDGWALALAPVGPAGGATGHAQQVFSLGYSPDGQYVISASRDKRAVVWSTATGRPADLTLHHSGSVTEAAFTSDGWGGVTVSGAAAYRWDLPWAGARSLSIPVPGVDLYRTVAEDALSPDGRVLAAGGERQGRTTGSRQGWARAWSTADGKPLTPELLQAAPVTNVVVSPGGPLRVCTTDRAGNVRLWDEQGGMTVVEEACEEKAVFVAAGHDGRALKLLVLGRRNQDVPTGTTSLRVYRIDEAGRGIKESETQYPQPLTAAVFAPGCRRAAAYAGTEGDTRGLVVVWDVGPTPPVSLQQPGINAAHRGPVTHVGFSRDGRLVTASQDDTAVVWALAGGRWAGEVLGDAEAGVGHTADVLFAAFDDSGDRVVTAGEDGSARVWVRAAGGAYTAKAELRAGFRNRGVTRAAFAGDRLVVTASTDNVVRVWDTRVESSSGRLVAVAPQPVNIRGVRWRAGEAGEGTVLAVGLAADPRPSPVPNSTRPNRLWSARFVATECPLTRLPETPVAEVLRGAELVAARRATADPVQLAVLPPGEAFDRRTVAAPPAPSPADTRRWHAWEATQCEAAGNWEGALWHWDKLLEGAPTDGAAYARRARVQAQLVKWADAEEDYARALSGPGPNWDALRARAQMRYSRAEGIGTSQPEARKAQFEAAIEDYRELVRSAPGDRLDGVKLAEAHLMAGNPPAAADVCDQLLDGSDDVDSAEVLLIRAKARSSDAVRQRDAAFQDFVRAARAFAKHERWDRARGAYAQAFGLEYKLVSPPASEVAAAHAGYGDVLLNLGLQSGLDADALMHFRAATDLAPEVARYWLKLGRALEGPPGRPYTTAGAKRLAEAEEAFTAKGRHPTDTDLLHARARVLLSLRRWDDALMVTTTLTELRASALYWRQHADALVGLRRWDDAVRAYQRSFDLDRTFPDARERLSAAAVAARNLDLAGAVLAEAAAAPAGREKVLGHLALVQLGRADNDGYQKTCARIVESAQELSEDQIAGLNDAAWVLALSPDPRPENLAVALEMAQRAVNSYKSLNYRNTLAAVLYRKGRAAEAVSRLEEIQKERVKEPPSGPADVYASATDLLFLSLAYRSLGQHSEAGKELEAARQKVDSFNAILGSNDDLAPEAVLSLVWNRLELQLLLGQAERDPAKKE